MDLLDKQIMDYLKSEVKAISRSERFRVPPSEEDFYLFITGKLEGRALADFLDYLKTEESAQIIVTKARTLVANEHEVEEEKVPAHWTSAAKDLLSKGSVLHCPYCGKQITPFKKPIHRQQTNNVLWFAAAVASFAASFYYKHYFYQFLALSLFFGIKWIVDRKSSKTQILIYKALKDEEEHVRSIDLHKTQSHL